SAPYPSQPRSSPIPPGYRMASPDAVDPALADLAACVRAALASAGLPDADAELEQPKQPEHGDWATTVALRLAKAAGRPPRQIAQLIVDHLDVPGTVAEVSVAGPGFVNFRLSDLYRAELLRRIVEGGDTY